MSMRENDLLSLLVSSKLRQDILLYLGDGPKTLSDIRDHLRVSPSQLSTKIKELQEHNLISVEKKACALTLQGKIVLENYWPFANTVELFERQAHYWKIHDLNCIPEELRYRIGELHGAEYIRDDPEDMNRTLTSLMRIMDEAEMIAGLSPLFEANVVAKIIEKAREGTPVEMVLSSAICDRMKEENKEIVEELASLPNYRFSVTCEEIKTPFVLTDKHIFFSTYYSDGTFDTQSNLVGSDPIAVQWGADLLEYYRARSVRR